MTTFNTLPPRQPHQRLARAAAQQWASQHPLRAAVVRVLARLGRSRQQPSHHPLEHCPETPQDGLEALLDRWTRHWYGSLASTPEGRLLASLPIELRSLQLDLRDKLNDIRLDQQGW
jgi:cation transport ATPase